MFPTEQAWMINPHKAKKGMKTMARRKRAHAKRRTHAKKRVFRHPRKVVVLNPRRRRARKSYAANPARSHRRSRRRSYHSNPKLPRLIPTAGFIQEIAMIAGGFYATKISAGFVLPMVGIAGDLPRIAVKSVVAWGVSALGGMVLGSRAQQNLLIGGALEVFQDAIKTYVSPYVPALAAADMMEAYYLPSGGNGQSVSSYYQVGNELPSDNVAV